MSSTSKKDEAPVEQELYAKREKIYAREVHGIFAALRLSAMAALLGLYYGVPWLQWDGHQAILFDLPARKFYIFGLTFWPQDFFYLAVLLILAALSLFMFTALAGRLWCGYACPQTVWTEIFMWFDRKIEGSNRAQKKLDSGKKDFTYYRIKISKHAVWLTFSIWTGLTFVGYFTPIRELSESFITWQLGPWETFWIFFYGFATYGNAGFMREQVCIYMCPYARFQSAMIDHDSLIISYDSKRGDPRGARKRNVDPASINKGDCVDCGLCVQVCPTGIDIRNGLQYQCIGCAACIDVCDEVMDKMGYDKGLVRYTTENALNGSPSKLIRPRILVYISLLAGISLALLYSLATRIPLEVDIIRDRSALYTENQQGLIENVYNLKIINMDPNDHHYEITVEGLEGISFSGTVAQPLIRSGEVTDLPIRIQVDPDSIKKSSNEIFFNIVAKDNPDIKIKEHARFLGPVF